MTGQTALFSSKNIEWETPQKLFDELNKEFEFDIDVCATFANKKVDKFFSKEVDGLIQSWAGLTCWMNPPYGKEIAVWMCKAYFECKKNGATVVCLVPARTDTKWWHKYAIKGEIRYILGRLKFSGSKNNCTFPSVLVIFRPQTVK